MRFVQRDKVVRLCGQCLCQDVGIRLVRNGRGRPGNIVLPRFGSNRDSRPVEHQRQGGFALWRLPGKHLIRFRQNARPHQQIYGVQLSQLEDRSGAASLG